MKREKLVNLYNKHITKIIFFIEFLTSLIFSVLTLKIFTTKHYEGYWSLKYILEIIPVVATITLCIAKNVLVNKKNIEKIWIGFLIPVGMLFLIFIVPSHAPDENAHLWKSYEISEGVLITKINKDGSYPTTIPKFFAINVIPALTKYNQMLEITKTNTEYNDTTQVTNPASSYFPFFYIIPAIGLLIGRALCINGIYAIYLARLCNYVLYLVLGYYSIKKIPFGKIAVGVLLFFPMCLQQGTSISIDCLINSLSIFYISYTLYLRHKKDKLSVKEKIIYTFTGVLIAMAKFVYFPICCLCLLIVSNNNITKKEKIGIFSIIILLSMIFSVLWYKVSTGYVDTRSYLTENNVSFSEQIKYIINNPKDFTKVIYHNIINCREGYLYGAVGENLGWLNINIPHIKITVLLFIFIASIFFEENKYQLNRLEKAYMVLVTIGIYLLVIFALYCGWSPVGGENVMGVQGRYFIPVLLLPILCLGRKENYIKSKNLQIILPIVLSLIDITVLKYVFNFFV